MPNDDVITPALDRFDAFVARGHAIITDSLAGAERLAVEYPAVRLLLPVIKGALHELFNHMVEGPKVSDEPAQDGEEQLSAPAAPAPGGEPARDEPAT